MEIALEKLDSVEVERTFYKKYVEIPLLLLLTNVFLAGWQLIQGWAFLNTVQAHAYCLPSLHSLFTTLFEAITCKKVSKQEYFASLLIVISAGMITMDPHAKRIGEKENIQASLLSLTANIPGAIFWKMNKVLEGKKIDIKTNIFWQTFFQSFLYTVLSIIYEDSKFFDMSDNGVFGFLRADNIFFCLFIWSFVVGFWACAGYVWSLLYFNPLIVMNCLLIEPLTGQVVGVLMDIDEIPGFLTWFGVFLVLVAINVLKQGQTQKVEEEKKELKISELDISKDSMASSVSSSRPI